jgi:hypothetical protein
VYVLRIVETLSIVAALATAAQAGALITQHVLPTGYNPRSDAVSDYGVGRYRAWFWAQAVAGGVAGLALAIAFAETTPSIPTVVPLPGRPGTDLTSQRSISHGPTLINNSCSGRPA